MSKILERQDKVTKKRKLSSGQQYMDNYHDSTDLPDELAQVNNKVKIEIESETNLTITFDGWTSHIYRSIWNFIVITPSRKKYLYQLSDLSECLHTAEYLSSVIEKVIVDIEIDQISAVVSDNASNVKKACEIIQDKFPTIKNVRCIMHCINLIACDIVKEEFGDRKADCWRWVEIILQNTLDYGKKTVLALEAKSATLADCFLSLAKLAAMLNKSRFRSAALKKVSLKKIIKCVVAIDEEDPFDLDLSIAKQSSLNWWKLIATDPKPELLPKVVCYLLSICPNSATCERGFSTLGWLFERRLNLKLTTLESMYKLITYWKSNSKTELDYYGVDQRKNVRFSDDKINICIVEAFKETDEDDDDDLTPTHKSTDIDVPKNLLDDFNENMNDDNRVSDDASGDEDDNRDGKGYYNYDVDDLLSNTDKEEED
ncbi:hypothetical protein RhiirA5_437909 [Rhizophagus irregularis]|uniref:DUF659 domain-containing protein n=1 Tax=Rhizophagus irregularis TaxID=588596 RepID=A0A2N0NJV7_9GLOM|nr:hypothetical protein RhiirA5_437909 [Rhizophagus irregularis]